MLSHYLSSVTANSEDGNNVKPSSKPPALPKKTKPQNGVSPKLTQQTHHIDAKNENNDGKLNNGRIIHGNAILEESAKDMPKGDYDKPRSGYPRKYNANNEYGHSKINTSFQASTLKLFLKKRSNFE